jgi:hypothetical protein
MTRTEFLYGTGLGDCVQHIVVRAVQANTANAYHDAAEQLRGIERFLTWTGGLDSSAALAFSNHIVALALAEERAREARP